MTNDKNWKGHVSMLVACAIWGLMAPLGKDAMDSGITALTLATFRMTGGAICFWIASFFTPNEHVKPHDLMMFFFAGLLSIVLNQGSFTLGLSLTSPINASIVTTTMPIVTMILAALFLKEPITGKKIIGVFLGALGALMLILSSANTKTSNDSSITGDLLCLLAQCSFATYLTLFKHLISKYSIITCMKWMFTYAAMCFIPFTYNEISTVDFSVIAPVTWAETAFVVIGATFFAYILMMNGQKTLRPTIVSMYNYVQPIVASIVTVAAGMGTFGLTKGIAVILVFAGVYIVTQSKSRKQIQEEETAKAVSPNTTTQV